MSKKIRVNITIDATVWQELGKYIDVSKSAWVEQQARKQIERHDTVAEIDMKIQAIEYQQKNLAFDKSALLEEREQIINKRKVNEQNAKLINDVMFTIRTIADNQGYIEENRVEFIADKNNLDSNILFAQIEKENIKTVKGTPPKKRLVGDGTIKSFKGL